MKDDLQSVVIVRFREGFQAVARFNDPKQDFIVQSRSHMGCYYAVERELNRRLWGRRG